MELKQSADTDDFRYFDPKLLKSAEGGSGTVSKSRAPYQDAIVFMVGGGNYAEYQNLVDYAKVGFSFKFYLLLRSIPFQIFFCHPVKNHWRKY